MPSRLSLRQRRLTARGFSPRHIRAIGSRTFLGTGAQRGVYVSPQGYTVVSKDVTAGSTQPRFGVVIAGASTPASVTVSGRDVTFNSATNGSSAATSTVKDLVRAVQANRAASALVSIDHHKGELSGATVQARALTALAPQQS